MGRMMMDERHERAAELLIKVQAEGAPPEAFVEMLAWCDADPANRLAMERIEEAWAVGAELTPAPVLPVRQSLFGRMRIWTHERFGLHGMSLMAGSMAALVLAIGVAIVAGGIYFGQGTAPNRIATARAMHDKAQLPDGSSVELGGRSSLSVVYSSQNRVVVAEDGETLFRVSKDPSRPFIVRAGPVTVTAVGTAFVVRRAGESVSVAVTEGAVDVRVDGGGGVSEVRAAAGQLVRYDRGRLSESLEMLAPEAATAWREGQLQFVDEPLRLVIASINRYYEREVIIDPSLEDLRFTGTVFENGIDAWLRGLPAAFPARVVNVDKRRVRIAPATVGS